MFQFHSGSIKRRLVVSKVVEVNMFQFHSGSIKSYDPRTYRWAVLCFNSIVVRLKGTRSLEGEVSRTWFQFHSGSIKSSGSSPCHRCETPFQFHSGSIKSCRSCSNHCSAVLFQFHSGSIKRRSARDLKPLIGSFNSIVVRLKDESVQREHQHHLAFQFHSGSIKSHDDNNKQNNQREFQFHSGSIKSKYLVGFSADDDIVSIP